MNRKLIWSLDVVVAKDGAKEASYVGAEVIASNAEDALQQHWDLIDSVNVKQVHLVLKGEIKDEVK